MDENKAVLPFGRHIIEVSAGIQWQGEAAQNIAQEYWRLLLYSVQVFSVTALSEYYTLSRYSVNARSEVD